MVLSGLPCCICTWFVADLMWLPRHLFGFSFQDSTHLSQTKLFTRFLFFVISFFALDGNVFMPKYQNFRISFYILLQPKVWQSNCSCTPFISVFALTLIQPCEKFRASHQAVAVLPHSALLSWQCNKTKLTRCNLIPELAQVAFSGWSF